MAIWKPCLLLNQTLKHIHSDTHTVHKQTSFSKTSFSSHLFKKFQKIGTIKKIPREINSTIKAPCNSNTKHQRAPCRELIYLLSTTKQTNQWLVHLLIDRSTHISYLYFLCYNPKAKTPNNVSLLSFTKKMSSRISCCWPLFRTCVSKEMFNR